MKIKVEGAYISSSYEYSPNNTTIPFQAEEDHLVTDIIRYFPSINSRITSSRLDNNVYQKGVFLLLKYDPLYPEFDKIVDILLLNNIVIFSLILYVSEVFVSHFNSFLIKPTCTNLALPLDVISYSRPLYSKRSFVASVRQFCIVIPFSY